LLSCLFPSSTRHHDVSPVSSRRPLPQGTVVHLPLPQGTVVHLPENQSLPRQMKQFSEAAAQWLFVAVQRLQPPGVGGEAAKRQAGAQMGKLKPMENALRGQ